MFLNRILTNQIVKVGEAPSRAGREKERFVGMGTHYLAMTIINKKRGISGVLS